MRKAALSTAPLALVAAGAFAFAASGGGTSRGVDVAAANGRTARAASVHYALAVTLAKQDGPLTLHVAGAASRDAVAVRLRLSDLTLKDGTTLPGTTGAVRLRGPFLYERAPGGLSAAFGSVRWLRLPVSGMPASSQTLSAVRALTPAPLLRVVAEARLRPAGGDGAFAGPVAYDDPVVRTALRALAGGIEFRGLRVVVRVGRDGLVHGVGVTGRTADGKTSLSLRAHLYGFGRPVRVVPPKPGSFMDRQLAQLAA